MKLQLPYGVLWSPDSPAELCLVGWVGWAFVLQHDWSSHVGFLWKRHHLGWDMSPKPKRVGRSRPCSSSILTIAGELVFYSWKRIWWLSLQSISCTAGIHLVCILEAVPLRPWWAPLWEGVEEEGKWDDLQLPHCKWCWNDWYCCALLLYPLYPLFLLLLLLVSFLLSGRSQPLVIEWYELLATIKSMD